MRISGLSAQAYAIPTDAPEADGTFTWDQTTVVVVQVHTDRCSGLGWTYAPAACVDIVDALLAPAVVHMPPADSTMIHRRMWDAVRNATKPGLVSMAISAVDNAVWDLRARLLDIPLDELLGRARVAAPLYGSGGFTTYDSEQLCDQVREWQRHGIESAKIKIGEAWGSEVARDLERVGTALDALGATGSLLVDANGAYNTKQAMRVGRELQERGVVWFEEPVSSDHHAGLRYLHDHLDALDVTAGEYGYDLDYFHQLLQDGCVDCLQIDVTRCGGITAWQQIAAVAAAHHVEVSAHCAPLQHLAVGISTPNLRHLEFFHDHERIERLMFDEVPEPAHGVLKPLSGPGHGLQINHAALAEFRLR